MNKRWFAGTFGLLAGLTMAVPALGSPSAPQAEVRLETLTVARPNGAVVALAFEVFAPDEASARQAAISALRELAPSAVLSDSANGSVSAQWLPWPWKWGADELPVKVAYNPTGAPPGAGPGVVTAGLQAWSSVASSSFRYQYAGVTENTATVAEFGPDGENVISWQSLDCTYSCVLGVTSKDPATHEVDMLLNSNPAAADLLGVGTRVDWRTVVLHELGHMAGLEHSCPVPFGPCTPAEADAVMFYQYRGVLRTLAPDDIAGISALYPAGGTAAPTPSVAPSPTPTPFPEHPVVLDAGWNLLVPPELSVGALSNGLPCLQAVYSYENGAWLSWIRGAPDSIQELAAVGPAQSYWMLANAPCGKDFP